MSITWILNAQEQDKNFVYLKSNEFVYGNAVDFNESGFKNYVLVDNKEFDTKDVKFFKNSRGFYAITRGVGPRSAPPVAGLVRQGKINLFESIVWTVSSNAGTSKRTYNFFNTELGNLKYANFRNLQPVMRSNPESMAHLYKFRNAGIAATTLQVGGFLTTLAGFGVFMARGFDSFENDTELKLGLPITLGLSGITMGACGYLFGLSKPKHLRMAVSTYNE